MLEYISYSGTCKYHSCVERKLEKCNCKYWQENVNVQQNGFIVDKKEENIIGISVLASHSIYVAQCFIMRVFYGIIQEWKNKADCWMV